MGPEGTEPGAFTVYCDGVPLQEIQEIRLPEVSPEDAQELEAASTSFCGEIQLVCDFDRNAFVAELPVVYRYLWHCVEKGWKPSERGLLGFIKLLRLGYYKTL